ncbi:hypothetical protein B0H16DRAFT_1459342 [Mycena metata]|uniref:Uncharacterized protein n=1 Tax=Mycena metata TaxID=1033252 RepID=A0AAD7NC09_9AGAR|nr:hypothetical protein B0H16DRAFT_1459342 [Mycena metata]
MSRGGDELAHCLTNLCHPTKYVGTPVRSTTGVEITGNQIVGMIDKVQQMSVKAARFPQGTTNERKDKIASPRGRLKAWLRQDLLTGKLEPLGNQVPRMPQGQLSIVVSSEQHRDMHEPTMNRPSRQFDGMLTAHESSFGNELTNMVKAPAATSHDYAMNRTTLSHPSSPSSTSLAIRFSSPSLAKTTSWTPNNNLLPLPQRPRREDPKMRPTVVLPPPLLPVPRARRPSSLHPPFLSPLHPPFLSPLHPPFLSPLHPPFLSPLHPLSVSPPAPPPPDTQTPAPPHSANTHSSPTAPGPHFPLRPVPHPTAGPPSAQSASAAPRARTRSSARRERRRTRMVCCWRARRRMGIHTTPRRRSAREGRQAAVTSGAQLAARGRRTAYGHAPKKPSQPVQATAPICPATSPHAQFALRVGVRDNVILDEDVLHALVLRRGVAVGAVGSGIGGGGCGVDSVGAAG